MSKVIQFPNAVQSQRGAMTLQPKMVSDTNINNQIHLGPWEFTCQRCQSKTRFESQNMIFRSVDFYCASCGSLHRVINPAFAAVKNK